MIEFLLTSLNMLRSEYRLTGNQFCDEKNLKQEILIRLQSGEMCKEVLNTITPAMVYAYFNINDKLLNLSLGDLRAQDEDNVTLLHYAAAGGI